MLTLPDRIWAKVDMNPHHCWEWQNATSHNGYGVTGYQGKQWKVHRLVYFAETGELPEVVRHTCDNPLCVRPNHLRGGTTADNVADRVAKDRSKNQHTDKEACVHGHTDWYVYETHRECRGCRLERNTRRH